jgi:hypothetical protein
MPVRITCPFCRSDLRLPEDLYEGPVQCPVCDGAFALRWHPRGAIPEVTPAPPSAPERLRRCRFCGAPLEPAATKCPECGEELLPGR